MASIDQSIHNVSVVVENGSVRINKGVDKEVFDSNSLTPYYKQYFKIHEQNCIDMSKRRIFAEKHPVGNAARSIASIVALALLILPWLVLLIFSCHSDDAFELFCARSEIFLNTMLPVFTLSQIDESIKESKNEIIQIVNAHLTDLQEQAKKEQEAAS